MHLLFNHIQKTVGISRQEFELVLSYSKLRKLKKNQLLLQEGELCTADFFVMKGCLQQYYLDLKGMEHVVQFAIPEWWIGDWYSILHQQPSSYYIEALKASEVLQFEYASLEQLFQKVPKLERYFRIIFQLGFAAQQRRIVWMQRPATERYEQFVAVYGYFENILSQSQVASYLGITRESLNRLKNQRYQQDSKSG